MWNFVNDKEVEEFGRQNVSVFVRKSNTVTLIVLSKGQHHEVNCRHFPNGNVCGVCVCVCGHHQHQHNHQHHQYHHFHRHQYFVLARGVLFGKHCIEQLMIILLKCLPLLPGRQLSMQAVEMTFTSAQWSYCRRRQVH